MKKELVERWCDALESGEYKQGKGSLYNSDSGEYCCLGVLCAVLDPDNTGGWQGFSIIPNKFKQMFKFDMTAQSHFVGLNDQEGWSFNELAKDMRRKIGLKAGDSET